MQPAQENDFSFGFLGLFKRKKAIKAGAIYIRVFSNTLERRNSAPPMIRKQTPTKMKI
ncbi:hypothetical protein LA52FAK_09060 [Desulforhopalus sp. 52FAK]